MRMEIFLRNCLLMMFYTTVTGWMISYTYYSAAGTFTELNTEAVGGFFNALLENPKELTLWMTIAILIGAAICWAGLRNGVERKEVVRDHRQ